MKAEAPVTFAERRAKEQLERRVAERTEELTAANEALKREVVERARVEQELRRDEFYLAEGQHIAHMGSWAFNAAGFDFWSPELFRIHGLDPNRKAPTVDEYMALVHPEDREFVAQEIQKMLADHRGFDFVKRIVRPDGEIRRVRCVGTAATQDGAFAGFLGTGMDVTEQERLSEELHALQERLQRENVVLREEVEKTSMFEEIVGVSAQLKAVLAQVSRVAPTDATVLIVGETGTGKELVARAIHKLSKRSARALVSVNCAAIPPSLVASELFGHEKGAFTGAVQRRQGRFELADGGTIFLDEVGELPPEIQITLLRVLQEREFERVGGNRPIRTDVRVIAASNRDLEAGVSEGTFRADLFYRLDVFPLEMPALRDRQADIPVLVEYFIHRYARRAGKRVRGIHKASLDLLKSYDWPGNVRELQNVVERAVIVSDSEVLSIDDRWLSTMPSTSRELGLRRPPTVAPRERDSIETALAQAKGRVSGPFGAATRLGVPSSTLESRIRALKIDKRRFKTPGSPQAS